MKTVILFVSLFVFVACQTNSNNCTKQEVSTVVSLTETEKETCWTEKEKERQIFPKVEISLDFGFKVLYGGQEENLSYNYLGKGSLIQMYTYDYIEIRKNDTVERIKNHK